MRTPENFPLRKGSVQFEQDKIVIDDSAKSARNLVFMSSIIWLVFGIIQVHKFTRTNDQFDLGFGLFLLAAHSIILVINLRRSVASQVPKSEIRSLKVKQGFASRYLQIVLNNGKVRRVDDLQGNTVALEQFVQSYLGNKNLQPALQS